MVKVLTPHRQKTYSRIFLLLSSLLITNLLFYIDEGYNDFRWMKDFGNWVVFVIYIAAMLSVQLFIFELIYWIYRWRGRVALGIISAWAVTFLLLVSFFFRTSAV